MLWLTMLLCAHAVPVLGNAFYASPGGSASGDGTILHPWDLATALANNTSPASTNHVVQPGDTISLRGGTYYGGFTSYLAGTSNAPIDVKPYSGERVRIEATNTNITGLYVWGGWTRYWNFEVWNSSSDRLSSRASGFMIFGPHTKLINVVVHDTGVAIGCWTQATNSEIYGCLMYNNGWLTPSSARKGHGEGIYMQNNQPTNYIRDNIMFNNGAWGMQWYAEPAQQTVTTLNGVYIEGNVSFNAGVISTQAQENILVGGEVPANNATVINNYGYYTPGFNSGNLNVGYQFYTNGNAIVQGNYMSGGAGAHVGTWSNLTFTGNTFVNPWTYFHVDYGLNWTPTNGIYNWHSNTYCTPYEWLLNENFSTGVVSYATWKRITGFDANSMQTSVQPTTTIYFIRTNVYEPGRANIIVYNWANNDNVSVDISGALPVGSRYEVRNAQDYFLPAVASGLYSGGTISLPMTNLTVATAVGMPPPPYKTGRQFNVFILQTTTNSLAPPAGLHVLNN